MALPLWHPAHGFFELEEMGPRPWNGPNNSKAARVVSEAGRHREQIPNPQAGRLESGPYLVRREPAEPVLRLPPVGNSIEPFSFHPGLDGRQRGREQASDGTGRESMEISRSLARPRDELEDQLTRRSHQRHRSRQQFWRVLFRESQHVAHHHDLLELASAERRVHRVALDKVEATLDVR